MPRPLSALRRPSVQPAGPDNLRDLSVVFDNPGGLRMRAFVPDGAAAGAPLVVVLHGCTQTAAGYDHAAGWSRLAAQLGFVLLFPEQVRANNPNRCFNWFEPGDTQRGRGEVASIAAAVVAMIARHRLDPARVFVTGLSAGGAMANALLATYPDVFAGGAIIAGLPFGTAHGVGQALGAMAHPEPLSTPALGDLVREASTFSGPWPRVMAWHGTSDRTVAPANGAQVAAQWADVHGATAAAGRNEWRNADGVVVVELIEVAAMGHGTPIDSRDGGIAAPFMLDVGIASSARIASFWGIGTVAPAVRRKASPVAPSGGLAGKLDVRQIVNDALRAAGLMK